MDHKPIVLSGPNVAGLLALALVLALARAGMLLDVGTHVLATGGVLAGGFAILVVLIAAAIGCMAVAILALGGVVKALDLAIRLLERRAASR